MTNNIFAESSPGQVSHTSLSLQLVAELGNPIRGVVGHQTEVVFKAASRMVEAHDKYGTEDQSATHAPFQLAFDTETRALDWIANDHVASARFAESMKGNAGSGPFSTPNTVKGFDWSGLGEALIVDVSKNLIKRCDRSINAIVGWRICWPGQQSDCCFHTSASIHRPRLSFYGV